MTAVCVFEIPLTCDPRRALTAGAAALVAVTCRRTESLQVIVPEAKAVMKLVSLTFTTFAGWSFFEIISGFFRPKQAKKDTNVSHLAPMLLSGIFAGVRDTLQTV